MNKLYILILISLFVNTKTFAINNQKPLSKFEIEQLTKAHDSTLNAKIRVLSNSIDSMALNVNNINQQQTYFTQALDSQKTGFSDFIEMYSNIITILFGLIGVGTLGGAYYKLNTYKEEYKKELEESTTKISKELVKTVEDKIKEFEKKYESIEKQVVEFEIKIASEQGQIYLVYANSLDKEEQLIEKFNTLIKSIKYFVDGKNVGFISVVNSLDFAYRKMKSNGTKLNGEDYNFVFSNLNKIITDVESSDFKVEVDTLNTLKEILASLFELKI